MNAINFTELMEKEVSRKEFLLYFGFIFITVTGISSIIKNLSALQQPKAEQGFGSKPYGM